MNLPYLVDQLVISFIANPYLSNNVRKHTFGHVRPAEIQISLRVRSDWSNLH